MSRNNMIDGLVDQLRLTNGFDAVSSGTALAYDHRALTQGVDRAAIVLAGERWEQQRILMQTYQTDWYLTVEVWIRHNSDVVQARQDADIYVGNIVNQINNNRTLGGSAFDALIVEGRVEDEKMEIGRTPYLLESLTVRVQEHWSATP